MQTEHHSTPVLNNRYQLIQTLGKGGMAVVYLAQDLMLERQVAIKVLRQNFTTDHHFTERFRQEAKSAANLSHPNIVTVHDFGFDAGRLFIVMEYVQGTDLKTYIKNRGKLPVDEAIALIVQACAGIGYAHRAGLIHCDVKPHNMLVTPELRLKVTDFGIARALSTISPEESSDVVWGSPQYFSPEQASGIAPSPASDVYSLGVVFYEMVTGQLPFSAENAVELARLHREANPTPPGDLNPEISPALEQIILKVLSKEPSHRYRTADQFGRILSTLNQQSTQYRTPTSSYSAASPVASRPRSIPHDSNMSQPIESSPDPVMDIDWATVGLGLAATLAVGGLIPFWLLVYFRLFPPIQ